MPGFMLPPRGGFARMGAGSGRGERSVPGQVVNRNPYTCLDFMGIPVVLSHGPERIIFC
jgi:hypothetical protein